MGRSIFNPAALCRFLALVAIMLLVTACSPATKVSPTGPTQKARMASAQAVSPTPVVGNDAFSDLPDEARTSTRPGDPRPAAYWVLWNTCAPGNRAEVAAANGGRTAGWILVDDLLADPGIQLGDYPLTTCEESVALLQARTTTGEDTDDPTYRLAAALLAAELSLNVGAETCPIAEEAVLGSQIVLTRIGFDGIGAYAETASDEIVDAIPRLVELLEGYNRGELCR